MLIGPKLYDLVSTNTAEAHSLLAYAVGKSKQKSQESGHRVIEPSGHYGIGVERTKQWLDGPMATSPDPIT